MSKPSTLSWPSGLPMERRLNGSWLGSRHMPDGAIHIGFGESNRGRLQICKHYLAEMKLLKHPVVRKPFLAGREDRQHVGFQARRRREGVGDARRDEDQIACRENAHHVVDQHI